MNNKFLAILITSGVLALFFTACGVIENPRVSLVKKYIQAVTMNDVQVAASYRADRNPAQGAEIDARFQYPCGVENYTFEIRESRIDGDYVDVYYRTTLIRSIYFVEIGGQLYINFTGGGAGLSDLCD